MFADRDAKYVTKSVPVHSLQHLRDVGESCSIEVHNMVELVQTVHNNTMSHLQENEIHGSKHGVISVLETHHVTTIEYE